MNHNIKIFVDFDGTITKKDVGENIFIRFGNQPRTNEIIEDIKNAKITGMEGWLQLFREAPDLTMEQVESFTKDFEIDLTFLKLVDFCKLNDIRMFVLSDGFDNYIGSIFKREGLSDIPYFSNTLVVTASGGISPVFPYTDEECTCCANCKRNHVLEQSDDEEFTVYIGNGSSDTCPAQYCDFIFAKDELRKFCEKERISYFPYASFEDVVKQLELLIMKKRLKKRHQAVLKRNDVYKLG